MRGAPSNLRREFVKVKLCLRFLLGAAASGAAAYAQTMPFISTLYPIMESAGCRNCHNPDGVASTTRLCFPDKDVPLARVEAFGRSLVELIDRQNPGQSLLFLKPTARIAHTGGERIPKGSPEEAVRKACVENLANLSGPNLLPAIKNAMGAANHEVSEWRVREPDTRREVRLLHGRQPVLNHNHGRIRAFQTITRGHRLQVFAWFNQLKIKA